ncbi:MAG: aminopeptidase P family protein [Chitinophagales bacterium]
MKYEQINNKLFIENRKRFVAQMKPNSIAIFTSNDIFPRNGDSAFKYRQGSDIFYLSGLDQEETILVLYPDAPVASYKEVAYVRETNEHIAVWEGEKYTKEKAREVSGINSISWNDNFLNAQLGAMLNQASHIYLNLNENDRAESKIATQDVRLFNELKAKYPLHNFERSAPIMAALRSIKQEIEIDIMQDACNITESAFRKVLDFVKPGIMEYEVEAEIIAEFIRKRGNGHAYEPIVASGANACVLHYVENNRECKDGDLLLMDFGCEYANYASDLTRTIPVNGKFSPRQKEVYQACLNVHHKANDLMNPGITLNEYNAEVKKLMQSALIDISLIDKTAAQKEKDALTLKYFPHGTSHYLGLDVHDIGNRYAKMEENMCFTIEPGIYIREEGIGIRIENDFIVKSGKNIDLMKNIPIEVDEIEDLMNA